MTDPNPLQQRIALALEREDALRWGYDHGFASGYGQDPETDGFVDAVLAVIQPELDLLAELSEARQHGAYTYCDQLVGHVNAAAFARKISEKRNALGQRDEAVRYANEQKQRAETAEQQRDRLADVLREVLVREVMQPIAPEDYARWTDVFNELKEATR